MSSTIQTDRELVQTIEAWGIVAVAVLAALVLHWLVYSVIRRAAAKSGSVVDDSIVRHSRAPMALVLAVAGAQLAVPRVLGEGDGVELGRHVLSLVQIGAVSWLVVRATEVIRDVVAQRYRIDTEDNLAARRIHTQVRVLRRTMVALVSVVAAALMLMTFPSIRQIGTTLLASAGVAGLAVGMAARPVLANLLAGIQIAVTQPIRLDDVVIVEGEWGRIEEITATYVVVGIWDDRRLILPLSWFIEHPFQNWTRTRADLLGTVMLHVDFAVPVEEVRQELKRLLDGSELWDRRVWGLQVTGASERTVELRALMSAANSGKAFDLRCMVRERLIGFLRERHPDSLPRTRAVLAGEPVRTVSVG